MLRPYEYICKNEMHPIANYNLDEYLLTSSSLSTIGEQDLNEPQSTQSTQRKRREGRERVDSRKFGA